MSAAITPPPLTLGVYLYRCVVYRNSVPLELGGKLADFIAEARAALRARAEINNNQSLGWYHNCAALCDAAFPLNAQ